MTRTPSLATNHLILVLFKLKVLNDKSRPIWMDIFRYARRMGVD